MLHDIGPAHKLMLLKHILCGSQATTRISSGFEDRVCSFLQKEDGKRALSKRGEISND